jgi:hypothetical protein
VSFVVKASHTSLTYHMSEIWSGGHSDDRIGTSIETQTRWNRIDGVFFGYVRGGTWWYENNRMRT